MATTFKTFLNNDQISSRTLLHEAIPLTGTVVSGTYADLNVKTYAHGMFTSYFDYPYLSSSANHVLDITAGYSPQSNLSASITTTSGHSMASKKMNIYNQMAQVLMGHDTSGQIRQFDEDGDLTGGTKMNEVFFVNFSRLLVKDEIKKGSFTLTLGVDENYVSTTMNKMHTPSIYIKDTNAQNEYRINSPAGEYGILYATEADGSNILTTTDGSQKVGLLFYQAGVAVITSSVFIEAGQTDINGFDTTAGAAVKTVEGSTGILKSSYNHSVETQHHLGASNKYVWDAFTSGTLDDCANLLRQRLVNIEFNNTTELNSSIYFCRVNNNDYNYSSNPTYVSGSKIVVKDVATDEPVSYITSVGLYSSDNELLAVAKLSEPLKKTPSNEFTLRVRLDY